MGFFKLDCYRHRLEVLEGSFKKSVPFECVRPGSGEESELGSRLPPALHSAVPIRHVDFDEDDEEGEQDETDDDLFMIFA